MKHTTPAIILACLAIAAPANAAAPPISGVYSDIHQSKESGDLYGYELHIMKFSDRDYYVVVMDENQEPEIVRITLAGHHIVFKAAGTTWAGDVTAKGIDFKCPPGVTANCVQERLPRRASFWKQD